MKKVRNPKTRETLREIVNLHDKMKNCYFWHPPASASGRRSYEKYNSKSIRFRHDHKVWEVDARTECSCSYIYYRLIVKCSIKNGDGKWIEQKKKFNVRTIKGMI